MKTTALLAAWLLGLACAGAHAAGAAPSCQQALEAGDFAQAAAQARAAMQAGQAPYAAAVCLARAEGAQGRHVEALAALQEAVAHAATPLDRAGALILLGNAHQRGQAFADASHAYQQALQLARQEEHGALQHLSFNLLGEAEAGAGRLPRALDYYQQGLVLAANDNERADSYAHLASAYSALGQHTQAIEYQIKAVLMQERAGDAEQYAEATIELGRICLVAQAYPDGEKWLGKFLAIAMNAGSAYWEARTRLMLGRLESAQGRRDAAQEQYARGLAQAEKAGAQELAAEIRAAAAAP